MRYIPFRRLQPSEEWMNKSRKALEEVRATSDEQRGKAIDARCNVWRELKPELYALSHGKCWYCESRTLETSPGDVDHNRPKKRVRQCPTHSGYWWCAFDYKNFRFGCSNCNRHKSTDFPLEDESKRVFEENLLDTLCEEPTLLDPTVKADTFLLTFNEKGMAQPSRKQNNDPKGYERAKMSITVYNLNRQELKNTRKIEVWDKVVYLIQEAKQNLLLQTVENSIAAREGYKNALNTLAEMIDERAAYSETARAALKLYRNLEWVDDLLTTA